MDGDDKVRPLRSKEFFNQGFVFLAKEGEPCLWCVGGERGSVLICPTCYGLALESTRAFVEWCGLKCRDGGDLL